MLKSLDIYLSVEPKISILVHVNCKTQYKTLISILSTFKYFFINLTIFLQVLNKCLTL